MDVNITGSLVVCVQTVKSTSCVVNVYNKYIWCLSLIFLYKQVLFKRHSEVLYCVKCSSMQLC